MKKITINDVAEKAGVSIGTVSRVFNGYTDISDATKNRVIKIAKEIGYSPNISARSLSLKNKKNLALILSGVDLNKKDNLHTNLISGVYEYAKEFEYEFFINFITTETQKEKNLQTFLRERDIAGAVIQGLKLDDPYVNELQKINIPIVLIDQNFEGLNIGTVSIDNLAASKEAVNYLIKEGHQNIVLINGNKEAFVSIEREKGYKEALIENNLPIKPMYIQHADFNEDTAYLFAKNILLEDATITAFFCSSDIMAIGVLKTVKELKLNSPDDISIVGFDNIILTEYTTPTITTISQDMQMIGQSAAKLLINLIKGNNKKRHICLNFELIIRNSSSIAKKKHEKEP